MEKKEVIRKTKEFVESRLSGAAHDWWHTLRVWQMAKRIGKEEKADLLVVELAALLHDVADWKFQKDHDDLIGAVVAKKWLESLGISSKTVTYVCEVVNEISFKGAKVEDKVTTLETKVVQDADRLDAIGAIGIARCFTYQGSKGRPIYDPTVKPKMHKSFAEYKKGAATSINHFYEKLLLLKERMKTRMGKRLAERRHQFMKTYLQEFFDEWDSKNNRPIRSPNTS